MDPELLELMSVDQRELLFRKMREEQLRRWKVRERELEKKKPWPKRTPRKVSVCAQWKEVATSVYLAYVYSTI